MAPTAAALALALVACGGGGGARGAAMSDQEKFQEAALKHAECMRRHGVNIPDPKPGRGLVLADGGASPEQFDRARKTCDREVGKLPAPQMSAKDQREFRDAALKHARCMRAHGIEFPDPTFGPNGTVSVEIGRGADPVSPAFRAADAKCQKLLGKAGVIGAGPAE